MDIVTQVKITTDDPKKSKLVKMKAMHELTTFQEILDWYKLSSRDKDADFLAISQLDDIKMEYAWDYAAEVMAGDDL